MIATSSHSKERAAYLSSLVSILASCRDMVVLASYEFVDVLELVPHDFLEDGMGVNGQRCHLYCVYISPKTTHLQA